MYISYTDFVRHFEIMQGVKVSTTVVKRISLIELFAYRVWWLLLLLLLLFHIKFIEFISILMLSNYIRFNVV